MFENVQKLKFSGAAFTTEKTLDIYPKANERMSIIYGRNGTGKSTIAKAFGKIRGNCEDSIVTAAFLDKQDNVVGLSEEQSKHIFVFDEDYIQNNIRLKEDGLSTIVMLGQQGNLEDQIAHAQEEYDELEAKQTAQAEICDKYKGHDSVLSPDHFLFGMNLALSGDGHWAGREREIGALRRNASVSNDTYKKIVTPAPELSEGDVISQYREKFGLLTQARQGNAKISDVVPTVVPELKSEEALKGLLEKKLERPELSEREEYLLTLIESGRLEKIQKAFSSEAVERCPFCFQPITSEYRLGLIESIRTVLSRDVEEHQTELSKFQMSPLTLNLTPFNKLDSTCLQAVEAALSALNEAISDCNLIIQKKIDDPFTPIPNCTLPLHEKREALINALANLEMARKTYNEPFENISKLQSQLVELNRQRAYYEILPLFQSYGRQLAEKGTEDEKLRQLITDTTQKKATLDSLNDQKRSVSIAVDVINHNLRYVFFAENRLTIKSENGIYSLLSRGHEVKPADISVGERNVIALCYFFADMLTNLRLENGYCNEMFVVIDDPVSSFDFENKVGIMSFLRAQIKQLMCDNPNTKLLVLTHDLSAVFDIEKSFSEVKDVAASRTGKPCIYHLFELDNKELKDFRYKKRNEYSELLKVVFEYAKSQASAYELTIGNTMRRALETFATFVYKKGIDTISCDDDILDQLVEPEYKSYFGNLMYRLVLNGESHMEERARTLIDPDFTIAVSSTEKQRTAQDIICFMYLLNPIHVKMHLDDLGNVESDIQAWCNRIKQFEQTQH